MMRENTAHVFPASKNHFENRLKTGGQWYDKDLVSEGFPASIVRLVKKEIVEGYLVFPVARQKTENKDVLTLVTSKEQNFKNISHLEELTGFSIKLLETDFINISKGIKHYYNVDAKDEYVGKLIQNVEPEEEEVVEENEDLSPLQDMATKIIVAALNRGASDIHIEPVEKGSRVEFRIDGRIVDVSHDFPILKREKAPIVNIFKNMCKPAIDSMNKTNPAGGSFNIQYDTRWIDIRVSTMPTILGQKVEMRLLDTSRTPLDLDKLGFFDEDLKNIMRAFMKPSGLFLITGPTGSGKSTTLHSGLKILTALDHKTITIEDPVEYKDERLTQVQIKETELEKLSLDARKILKVALRQDPDNILYGEIRDEEDAAIALRAAQTGHRVFSTLHTEDCVSSLDRLFDMGIKRRSLLSKLNCIVSQRLVGLNCPNCSKIYEPSERVLEILTDQEREYIFSGTLRKGDGCPKCAKGVLGRQVLAEVLLFNNRLRDFLREEKGTIEILEEITKHHGFVPMWKKGLKLVHDGKISLEELTSIIHPDR